MSIEYYVSRVTPCMPSQARQTKFQYFVLVKFEGGPEPIATYFVRWDSRDDTMHCDCPNSRSGRHVDDKHGRHVRKWLAAGEPTTPLPMDGLPAKPYKKRYDPHEDYEGASDADDQA